MDHGLSVSDMPELRRDQRRQRRLPRLRRLRGRSSGGVIRESTGPVRSPTEIGTYRIVAIKRTTTPKAAIASPTRMAGGVNRRSSSLDRFASARRAGEAFFDGGGQGEAAIPWPIHAMRATPRPIRT